MVNASVIKIKKKYNFLFKRAKVSYTELFKTNHKHLCITARLGQKVSLAR